MRTKEDSADYRYFPDPDLPPLIIDAAWIAQLKAHLPELPRAMAERLQTQYGLSPYDAAQLTQSPAMGAYFEASAAVCQQPKLVSNWLTGEISRRLNAATQTIEHCPVNADSLGLLLTRIHSGAISNNAAKQVLDALWSDGGEVDAIIAAKGLAQMNDSSALEKIVLEVIAANSNSVAQYKAGNAKALNALVGQIMKASAGKANPTQASELLKANL